MPKRFIIHCAVCGASHETAHHETKYCSRACMAMAFRRERRRARRYRCRVCDRPFYRRPCEGTKYCSHACYIDAKKETNRKVCPVCNRRFHSKHATAIYCSRDCSSARRRIKRICRACKSEFHSHKPNRKYCSLQCVPHMIADTPQQVRLRRALRWQIRNSEVHLPVDHPLWRMSYMRLDLAHRTAKVAIEIDGSSHDKPEQQDRDRRKESALRDLGWEVLRFTNREVSANPTLSALRVRVVVDARCRPYRRGRVAIPLNAVQLPLF